jgi:hypothetical protein
MSDTTNITIKGDNGNISVEFAVTGENLTDDDKQKVLLLAEGTAYGAFGQAAQQLITLSNASDQPTEYTQRVTTTVAGIELEITATTLFRCDQSFVAKMMATAAAQTQLKMLDGVVPVNMMRLQQHLGPFGAMMPMAANPGAEAGAGTPVVIPLADGDTGTGQYL